MLTGGEVPLLSGAQQPPAAATTRSAVVGNYPIYNERVGRVCVEGRLNGDQLDRCHTVLSEAYFGNQQRVSVDPDSAQRLDNEFIAEVDAIVSDCREESTSATVPEATPEAAFARCSYERVIGGAFAGHMSDFADTLLGATGEQVEGTAGAVDHSTPGLALDTAACGGFPPEDDGRYHTCVENYDHSYFNAVSQIAGNPHNIDPSHEEAVETFMGNFRRATDLLDLKCRQHAGGVSRSRRGNEARETEIAACRLQLISGEPPDLLEDTDSPNGNIFELGGTLYTFPDYIAALAHSASAMPAPTADQTASQVTNIDHGPNPRILARMNRSLCARANYPPAEPLQAHFCFSSLGEPAQRCEASAQAPEPTAADIAGYEACVAENEALYSGFRNSFPVGTRGVADLFFWNVFEGILGVCATNVPEEGVPPNPDSQRQCMRHAFFSNQPFVWYVKGLRFEKSGLSTMPGDGGIPQPIPTPEFLGEVINHLPAPAQPAEPSGSAPAAE